MSAASKPLTLTVSYQGQLRTLATHLRSGDTLLTDAPVDNQGKGESFSPTDLLATSLATCVLTIIGIAAEAHQIDVLGMHAEVTKHMGGPPRRVVGINIDVRLPAKPYTTAQRKIISKAAESCPVGRSLHPDLHQQIRLTWSESTPGASV